MFSLVSGQSGKMSPCDNICDVLFESTPDCLILHQDFKAIFGNQHTLNFFGVSSQEDFQGRDIFDFINPKFHEQAKSRILQVIGGEKALSMEMQIQNGDNIVRDIAVYSAPVSHMGKPAVLTYFRDITDEKQIHRELETNKERLDLALKATRDGVWDWESPANRMVYSEPWAEMLGLSLSEVSTDPQDWRKLVHPEDHLRSQSLLENHLNGFIPTYEIEVRLRHRKGHYIWVLDRGQVVERDASGNPLRMAGTHRNITARKEAEFALEIRNEVAEAFLTRDTENPFQESLAILERTVSADFGVFLAFDSHNQLRVLAFHPDTFGDVQSMEEFLSSDLESSLPFLDKLVRQQKTFLQNSALVLPGYPAEVENLLGVPITNRKKVLGCIILGNKDGGFKKSDRAVLESLTGYIAPILESHMDAKAKESQLQQAQKMEALGALAGGIAHDFNNILQAIMGFSTLAIDDAEKPEVVTGDLARVIKAAKRGQELVKRILLFSRREEQTRGPVDITALATEAVNLLKPTIPSTIEIRVELEADGVMVLGDPSQINQVILNLATNAYHAMEKDGGLLDIQLRRVKSKDLSWNLPPALKNVDLVGLTVSDTGVGMSPWVQTRVFDPFFTTREVGKGTGLGLSVVHGLVQAHGGDIFIESQPDSGTTATVIFPCLQEIVTEVSDGSTLAKPLDQDRNKHIVVLDDEQDITDLAQALLMKLGYQVSCESNGRSLLAKIELNPGYCDLLITDLTMPEITGLQLADRISKFNPDLPIILITGMVIDSKEMLQNFPNVRGFLPKPFTGDSLRKAVEQVLLTSSTEKEH